jgi:serine/threonine protein phosphatase PrpC
MGDFELTPSVRALPDVFRYALSRDVSGVIEKDKSVLDVGNSGKETNIKKPNVRKSWMKVKDWLNEWEQFNKDKMEIVQNSSSSRSRSSQVLEEDSIPRPLNPLGDLLAYTQTITSTQSFIPPSLVPLLDKWLQKPTPVKSRGYSCGLSFGGYSSVNCGSGDDHSLGSIDGTITCDRWARTDICLVLACDGLYDVMDEQQIAETCCPWMTGDVEERVRVWDDPVFDYQEDDEVLEGQENDGRDNLCDDVVNYQLLHPGNCNSPPLSYIDSVQAQESLSSFSIISPLTTPQANQTSTLSQQFMDGTDSYPPTPVSSVSTSVSRFHNGSSSSFRRPIITKGRLAEFAALRLRTAADALDSTDNVSVIVVML